MHAHYQRRGANYTMAISGIRELRGYIGLGVYLGYIYIRVENNQKKIFHVTFYIISRLKTFSEELDIFDILDFMSYVALLNYIYIYKKPKSSIFLFYVMQKILKI